jgi:nitrite reductase/ring-hydroxylating ferredoxin subunit
MLGSFLSGWTDWSDTYGEERSLGLLHGSLNSSVLVLYVLSAILRLQVTSGQSVPAAVLAFVGFAVLMVGAYFGGHLVFQFGTNVNHNAWVHGPDEYEVIGPLDQLADGKLTRVEVGGVPVVILREGERLCALAATCSHAGGPLDEGELVEPHVVKCPWHGSRFQLDSGRVVDGPATVAQPVYRARVTDGQVELKRQ